MSNDCEIDEESSSINCETRRGSRREKINKPFAPSAANRVRKSPRHQLVLPHFPSSPSDSPSLRAMPRFPVALRHICERTSHESEEHEEEQQSLWKINKLIDFRCVFISKSISIAIRQHMNGACIITSESRPAWRPARTFVSLRNLMSHPIVHVIE